MSGVVLAGAVLGAAVVAVVLAVGGRERLRRERELPRVAAQAGLSFSEVDRFNCTGVAFPLFRAGDGREVTNVMWRPDDGPSPTRAFDYAYYVERENGGDDLPDVAFSFLTDTGIATTSSRSVSRSWHRYSCALAQHNGNWPAIRIAREGLVERAFQKLGLPDIDFESDAFNRMFVVQCPDRRFASALLDPQMMELLLGTNGEIVFETRGRFLLLTAAPVGAAQMPALLGLAEAFLAHVPPVVRDLYPSFPDGAGTDIFPMMGGDSLMGLLAGAERDPDAWDPTPGVDHDLDGHPVAPVVEDPWHDRPLPPHAS